jgi:phosphoglycolate phosphatase-like HAD superfamily hydrolase
MPVIFDFDGTLFDSTYPSVEALVTVIRQLKLPHDDLKSSILNLWGAPLNEIVEIIADKYGWKTSDKIDVLNLFCSTTEKEEENMFAVPTSFLRELSKQTRIAILSSRRNEDSTRIMKKLQWDGTIFSWINFGDDYELHKPNPKVLHHVLNKMGGKGTEPIIYVGDSSADEDLVLNYTRDYEPACFVAVESGSTTFSLERTKYVIKGVQNIHRELPGILEILLTT